MDNDHFDAPRDPPAAWLDALERADADLAAGRSVPWPDAHARLLAQLAAIEAAQACRRA